jgi:anthraniloyl-CoA monooxygenase
VLKLQSAARNRMEWFENVARYAVLPPRQFAYSLLTGSQRIGHENLKVRDGISWRATSSGWPIVRARAPRRARRCFCRCACAG